MIGKLTGIIDAIEDDHCILDVHGVGYKVFCSSRYLQQLQIGDKVVLWIETHVREDSFRLFGFVTQAEKRWFTRLQDVQGVGAKSALAILGIFSGEELSKLIYQGDITGLCRAPGIGKKVAQRLITELKNVDHIWQNITMVQNATTNSDHNNLSNMAQDACSALENLGYSKEQARKMVHNILQQKDETIDTSELIRLALKTEAL